MDFGDSLNSFLQDDVDLDLEDDKIKTFLLNKLEEVKLENKKLERNLNERKRFLKKLTDEADLDMDEGNVSVGLEVWKRVFKGSYALGFKIVNVGEKDLSGIQITLKWNSAYPLMYTTHIFETVNGVFMEDHDGLSCTLVSNTLKQSNKIKTSGILVVQLEIPDFLDKTLYEITGFVSCCSGSKELKLSVPYVQIAATDHSDETNNVTSKNEIENLLTIMCCNSQRYELIMVLPEYWDSSLESTFEIHGSFTKFYTNCSCTTLYISHRVSTSFDDSLLAVHGLKPKVYALTVYTRTEDILFSLLHHLHCRISGVLIFPKLYYENYLLQESHVTNTDLHKFMEALKEEALCVYGFLQCNSRNTEIDRQKIVQFRSKLADSELKTDAMYLKVCSMNK